MRKEEHINRHADVYENINNKKERGIIMHLKKQQIVSWIVTFMMLLGLCQNLTASQFPAGADESMQTKRYVVFEYTRPDGDYKECNIWVWSTGAKDGQVDFAEQRDGKAIAYIEIGPLTKSMGYKIRKGTNWDTCVVDINKDREIKTPLGQAVTKIKVTYGEEATKTLAAIQEPILNPVDGSIKFFYRNDELFKLSKMSEISGVKIIINDKPYDMMYNARDEFYEYIYKGLVPGKYYYDYKVTYKDGTEKTFLDSLSKKTESGKSMIEYSKMNIAVGGTVLPGAISYDQNAVLNIAAAGTGEDAGKKADIKSISVDLTALGGKADVAVDKELMAITIAAADKVSPGIKQIPIKVMDQSSNVYEGKAQVEIKTSSAQTAFDWDEAVIYFMLTDRFNNGDPSNDDPDGNHYKKEDRGTYHGGDFKGVTAKLDYLKKLGVNTLWITPVVDNIDMNVLSYENAYTKRAGEVGNDVSYYGYHGYWANNFEKLNPHLGTLNDFHTLIDEAHARNMKIMVDVVLNHTGYGLKASDKPDLMGGPKDIKNFPTAEDKARFANMLRDGGTDSVYGEVSPNLPDFITENPEVRKKIIDWQVNWVKNLAVTPKGNTIDFFRIDTAKHVEPATLMALKNELTKVKPDFKYIVEAWLSSPEVDKYLNSGMADSALNFDFKQIAKDFISGSLDSAEAKLEEMNDKLNSAYTYGNFLGSHDEDGFLWSLQQGKKEDQKDLLKLAASVQMTSKGQPVIYYGEELGLSGRNNWPYYDNRYDMDWKLANDDNGILMHYQKMANIRGKHSEAFAKGTRTKVAGGDQEKYIAFERAYKADKVTVVINTGESKEISLKAAYNAGQKIVDEYSGKEYTVSSDGKVTITLPAPKDGGTVILAAK